MKKPFFLVLVVAALFLASLACEQAGEIMTPEEATQRAISGEAGPADVESAADAVFATDQEVMFASTGFLVPIYRNPGDTTAFTHVSRGSTGTIKGSRLVGEAMWYEVTSTGGNGWIEAKYLEPVEGAAVTTEEPTGPQPGDEVYLTGRAYLINIYSEPGSRSIMVNQERGVKVTILEVTELEGALWYKIDAPAGDGWVAADNITTEAP